MESFWIVMSYLITGVCGCVIGAVFVIASSALIISGRRNGAAN